MACTAVPVSSPSTVLLQPTLQVNQLAQHHLMCIPLEPEFVQYQQADDIVWTGTYMVNCTYKVFAAVSAATDLMALYKAVQCWSS